MQLFKRNNRAYQFEPKSHNRVTKLNVKATSIYSRLKAYYYQSLHSFNSNYFADVFIIDRYPTQLTVRHGLNTTGVSCLMLVTAFSVQSIAAQAQEKPIHDLGSISARIVQPASLIFAQTQKNETKKYTRDAPKGSPAQRDRPFIIINTNKTANSENTPSIESLTRAEFSELSARYSQGVATQWVKPGSRPSYFSQYIESPVTQSDANVDVASLSQPEDQGGKTTKTNKSRNTPQESLHEYSGAEILGIVSRPPSLDNRESYWSEYSFAEELTEASVNEYSFAEELTEVSDNQRKLIQRELDAYQNPSPSLPPTIDRSLKSNNNLPLSASERGWGEVIEYLTQETTKELAQTQPPTPNPSKTNNLVTSDRITINNEPNINDGEINEILEQLEDLPVQEFIIPIERGYLSSPALTISNPNGYGADRNMGFISASYQHRTRFTQKNDGELGFGIGIGNAVQSVGVELAYTINTFGTSSGGFGNLDGFGSGAFSIKVHRRIAEDFAIAAGWNQFLRIERNPDVPLDYPENSYYAVATKIFKTRPFINQPFSRLAITAGIGSGQFLPFDQIQEAVANDEAPTGLNVFGSLSLRVLRPLSAIVEWTGQDLGVGLSIVPFKNIPLVITPAIRDITGAGDGARFIMGAGVSIQL